ncbi:MAG: hypothetical protein LM582_04030 [Desulfurococcaceae archaeon]|jgi:dipeptide/tripeptide permease|nr:hypothetical protein [Desulfurococcaceae archaeon]
MVKLSIAKHLLYIFAISSILFMSIAALFIYMEKYIQSLLSFIIGILFLSSTLAILREGFRDEEGTAS